MSDRGRRDQLTDHVRGLLGDVLQQAYFNGSEALVEQASSVSVAGGPITMLELRTSDTAPASAFADGPIPLSMVVSNSAGDLIGELLVWVEHGYLADLEYAWWTDDVPDELPDSDCVRVTRK
jgi:hypothetical protein